MPSDLSCRARETTAHAPQLCPYRMMCAECFCSSVSAARRFSAEQAHDQVVGIAHPAVFKCGDMNCVGICFLEALCYLDGRVHGVVVADVAAEEADHDWARIVTGADRGRLSIRTGTRCTRARIVRTRRRIRLIRIRRKERQEQRYRHNCTAKFRHRNAAAANPISRDRAHTK